MNIKENKYNSDVVVLKEHNGILISHYDFRFVDISYAESNFNEVLISLSKDGNEICELTIECNFENPLVTYCHPNKGETLFLIHDADSIFKELDILI